MAGPAVPCEGSLKDIDQGIPESSTLVQAEVSKAVDSISVLVNACELTNEHADCLDKGSSGAPHDMSWPSSISPTKELINGASLIAEGESETDEDGDASLSVQPSMSERRRQQNEKFSSW
jgi:hypothetical protein